MLKKIFFNLIVKPILLLVMGMNIKNKENLPKNGPAIIIANHNSHLDTLSIMALFENRLLNKVKPIGAYDYFFSNKYISWISKNLLGVIPLDRKIKSKNPLENIFKSLDNNEIVIIFPEGTRGKPEQISEFKTGIYHISKKYPNVPVVPIYIEGLGKALPRNEALLVPFIVYLNIGKEIYFNNNLNKNEYMENLKLIFKNLKYELQKKEKDV